MPQEIKLNDEQKTAVEAGKRIGFLIAALNLPDEEKEQMLKLLPEMNIEQLAVLLGALEKNYLTQTGKQADEIMKRDLEQAESEYRDTMLAAQQKATTALDELEKKIAG